MKVEIEEVRLTPEDKLYVQKALENPTAFSIGLAVKILKKYEKVA